MSEQIERVMSIKKRYAEGKQIPENEMQQAQLAMGGLALKFKGLFPHQKEFGRGLDQVAKAFEDSLKNSRAMAEALQETGIHHEAQLALNQQLIDQEKARAAALPNAMKMREEEVRSMVAPGVSMKEFRAEIARSGQTMTDFVGEMVKAAIAKRPEDKSKYAPLLAAAKARDEAAADLYTRHPALMNTLIENRLKLLPHTGVGKLESAVGKTSTAATGPAAPPVPATPLQAMTEVAQNTKKMREILEKGPMIKSDIKIVTETGEEKKGGPGRNFTFAGATL